MQKRLDSPLPRELSDLSDGKLASARFRLRKRKERRETT
ncbi:hypothetical protein LEP1GSC085_2308 [Leptospira interrogans str. L0996]|nr:hypothetical protein LEP1GSC085_2308 [Leptospira interrogans str. L0996]